MSTEQVALAFNGSLDAAAVRRRRFVDFTVLADYWALTKPEVNFLIVVTTFAGFYLGFASQALDFPYLLLINTVLGTWLVASGAGTLNQYIERHFDAQMRRTSRRPLAAGRLNASLVLSFGVALSVLGSLQLAVAVNALASLLAIFTLTSYLFLYTPLKRQTPLCTLIGAVPGAMPPLIGWAAAGGQLTVEAWILFAVIFLWQFPHFMAIAWMYRDDYDRAGYRVLPPGERRNRVVAWQSLIPCLALFPISLAPTLLGHEGVVYGIAALLLTTGFLHYGLQLTMRGTAAAARRLLLASILYLPLIFGLMLFDRI